MPLQQKKLFFNGHDYFQRFAVWRSKIQIFFMVSLGCRKYTLLAVFSVGPLKNLTFNGFFLPGRRNLLGR
jgi:hypothetical protein